MTSIQVGAYMHCHTQKTLATSVKVIYTHGFYYDYSILYKIRSTLKLRQQCGVGSVSGQLSDGTNYRTVLLLLHLA